MKARRKTKRRLRTLAKGVGTLLVLATAILGFARIREPFFRHPYFALKEVQILPASAHFRTGEVLQLARLHRGQSIWSVSLREVRRQIEAQPRVERAAVRREFPSRLVLEIWERQPVAIVALDHLYYVDRHGVLFKRIGRNDPADYPILTGLSREGIEERNEETWTQVRRGLEFLRVYHDQKLQFRISEVRVEGNEGITFFLRDKPLSVKVGSEHWREQLAKFTRVMSAWQNRELYLSNVDLSVPQQAIVRLRGLPHHDGKKGKKPKNHPYEGSMGKKNGVIAALDIGTYKVCALVGELSQDGIEVIGIGTHPSEGLKKGVVINIESTVASIRQAVEQAQLMAGCEIHTVFSGIAGGHIKGFNSHGLIGLKGKEVTERDVGRVLDAARAVAIPMDQDVLHVLPQEFVLDGQNGIRDPVGMAGVRLEAKVHLITGSSTSAQNLLKCCERNGLQVEEIVLEPLASAEAVLTEEEKELGVALVDIGGGTTDIALFHEGSVKFTTVLGLGGSHLTGDLAAGLRTPLADAERIKQNYGCALTRMVSRDEMIEVPNIGTREPRRVSRQILCEILESRMDEILGLVQREIMRSGLEASLASGVVLTGGTTLLDGITDLAEEIFSLPVRRGLPMRIGGLVDLVSNPMYATGVGLILYGMKRKMEANGRRDPRLIGHVKDWMGRLLRDFF
jgi:cell division protein FtsA